MFPSDTLFLVLLSPAQITVALHHESSWCCVPLEHDPRVWTSIHVSCHTFESLPVIDSWARHGLGAHSHSVLYVWPVHRPAVQPGHCASVQTRLVCVQYIMRRCLFTLAIKSPHRLPEAFSCALTISVFALSDGWRDHDLRMLQIQCFKNSLSVSFVRDLRDPVVLTHDYPFQHDQRLRKITGPPPSQCASTRSVVHASLLPFQLVPGSA